MRELSVDHAPPELGGTTSAGVAALAAIIEHGLKMSYFFAVNE